MFNLKRKDNENEHQYLWRIGQAKDSGLLDMSWNDIANVMNKEFRDDESDYRAESAYRKVYTNAKNFYNAGVFDTGDSSSKTILTQQQELKKEQVKLRDERNELNRLIREEARRESFREQICRAITEHQSSPLLYDENKKFTGIIKTDNDLIISLTDIHAGIKIDNHFNKFNPTILKKRLNQYLDKIFEVYLRHGSENAYVILSELVNGLIHDTLRIESNQNIIEQFLMVTDYITEFLAELSYRFNNVHVYMCPGNHSRLFQDKDKALKGENIDTLALPFLEAKLQLFKNIYFHPNKVEESIAIFSVRGQKIFASHGDKDDLNTVVQKYTLMFEKPNIIYLGHRHTNAMQTVYDVKVIQSGCLSGSDSFCMNKRLQNRPEQTISVITDKGFDCLYDVKF